jgi:hypothetical protein
MATVNLYLVRDDPKDGARLFRRVGQPSNKPDIWIPRSVCKSVTKFPPPEDPKELRLCSVVLENWFANNHSL